jgi:hypothetical protein
MVCFLNFYYFSTSTKHVKSYILHRIIKYINYDFVDFISIYLRLLLWSGGEVWFL